MNCEIAPMKDRQRPVDTLPPRGKVKEVRREWLLHEDGALAYRLQDEEFKQHLSGNKTRNEQIREDIPCAKSEQTREQEEAMRMYKEWLQQQEAEDERLARAIAVQLRQEDSEKEMKQAECDKALARHLQDKEQVLKERRERERHRERRDLEVHTPRKERPAPFLGDASTGDLNDICAAVAGPSTDLNDVGLPVSDALLLPLRNCRLSPSPQPMSEDDARRLQEERDADLARRLQEAEEPPDAMTKDHLLAIETQDKELARLLWEKERARLRRAKERARARAAAKRELENAEEIRGEPKPRFPDPDEIVDLPEPRGNIAAMIDPTYPRDLRGPHIDQSFPRGDTVIYRASPVVVQPPGTPPGTLTHSSPEPESPNSVPPYMPIQGQRRFPDKKKEKTKDGCKQQ